MWNFAAGEAQFDVGSTTDIHTDTEALLGSFAFELLGPGEVGGGARISAFVSDNDLVEDSPNVNTSVTSVSAFPHLTIMASQSRLQLPIRIGPELRTHMLDLGISSSGELDYRCFGLGLEAEPQITLTLNKNIAFIAYGRAHFGAGYATIDTTGQDFRSTAVNWEAELGLRFQISNFVAGLGFTAQETSYRESEVSNNFVVEPTDFGFRGLLITAGIKW